MQPAAFGHSFNGSDLAVLGIEAEKQARQNRLTVDQHRARAALAQLAAVLGSGQPQIFAEDLKQCLMRSKRDFGFFAVQSESDQSLLALCASHSLVSCLAYDSHPVAVDFEPQRLYQTGLKTHRDEECSVGETTQ